MGRKGMHPPFRDIKLAAAEGKVLHPEDLSSRDLDTPLIEAVIPDLELRAVVEKGIEEAIRVGTEIAKIMEGVKPLARVMIAKTIYNHTLESDKRMVQMIKKSGLWDSI
jgi:hypothetical protein